MNNFTYIVTGASGYVGNVITKKLLELNLNVIGLIRNKEKADKIFTDKKPTYVIGDIQNSQDVENLFIGNNPFIVINTVAKVTIGEGDDNEAFNVTVNGCKNVINSCVKRNAKLIHISSTETLNGLNVTKEFTNYTPNPKIHTSTYGKAKSTADELILNAVKNDNLNACILLLSCVVGPYDYSNGHVTQLFIDFINGKLPASIPASYNFIDVRDVANVIINVIKNFKKGESYILATKQYKINDLLKEISLITGSKLPITVPMFVAYIGLPFVSLYCKLTKKRPLYTKTALKALSVNAEFPIDKTIKEFNFTYRSLPLTVKDQIEFLKNKGDIK